MVNLEELMLKNCSFEALPEQLHALTTLSIYGDAGRDGDDAYLAAFARLEDLTLSQSSIVLPPMPSLKNLTVMSASGTVDLRNLKSMPHLQRLELSRCKSIAELPQEVMAAKALTSVILGDLPKLKDITVLRDLPALTDLEIADCKKLSALPAELSSLTALESLKLDTLDKLSNISVVGELQALTTLEIDSLDALESLPESMATLTKLRTVQLEYCDSLENIAVLAEVSSLQDFTCESCEVSSASIKTVKKAIASRRANSNPLVTSYQSFMKRNLYKTLQGKEDSRRRYSFPLYFDTPVELLESMEDFDWLDDYRESDDADEDENETLEGEILTNAEGGLTPLAILDHGYEGCEDEEVDSYSQEVFLVDVDDPQNPVFIWTHDGSPARIHANFDAFLASLRDFRPDNEDDDASGEGDDGSTVYLELVDAKSSKFWQVTVSGSSHSVVYGKIGSKGTAKTKEFADEEAAQKDAERLVKAKMKKGYGLRGG